MAVAPDGAIARFITFPAIPYSYNSANQQVGYTDSNNNITATYLYNPDGLRKAKTINGITTSYGWDGDDIVLESTAGTPTSYVRGLQLVSYNSGITAADASYYLHDGHGNVTYLTNNNGVVTDTYRYDAFGSQLNTITALNPFQYCGEYLDSENGNYYLRARNYVPDLGRFTQWDSYAGEITNPISLNHYVYCYNDPIGLRDPSGNIPVDTLLDVGSFVVSAYQLANDPTWANLGFLIADGFAVIIPYAPGTYVVKATTKVDDAADGIKLLSDGSDIITKSTKLDGTGLYSEVKGHHVHAKAAFKGNVKYDPEKGFAIGRAFMDQHGLNHQKMTATQRELFKELHESGRSNTLEEHTRIAKAALKAGGASDELADDLIKESLKNLKDQGVLQPTRIPWYTK